MSEFTGTWSLIIGRFQCLPPHQGHLALIRTVLNEGGKVCIGLRESDGTEKNPYSLEERRQAFTEIFREEILEGKLCIINLPDIFNVVYGRGKGWGIRQIRLPEKTENISATEIRRQNAIKKDKN